MLGHCFQVKESLNHVQVLLDHQLMDMAWSDNLTDCEENLLKLATHLQVRTFKKAWACRLRSSPLGLEN